MSTYSFFQVLDDLFSFFLEDSSFALQIGAQDLIECVIKFTNFVHFDKITQFCDC